MKKIILIFVFFFSFSLVLAQEASNNIQNLLSSSGKILYGDEPNSIMVIDYPENIQRIAEYLETLDVPPLQVLIEARVVEVKLQKEHSLGVNWTAFSNKTGGPGLDLWRTFGISRMRITGDTTTSPIAQNIPYKTTYYPPGGTSGAETPFTLTIFDDNINIPRHPPWSYFSIRLNNVNHRISELRTNRIKIGK